MMKARLLAFLVCDRVTRDSDGKVTVHDIFDRIVLPQFPIPPVMNKIFCAYYKVDVLEPCVVSLCVIDPRGNPVPKGCWGDPIQQRGLAQSLWSLSHSLFTAPGIYTLQFNQRDDISPLDSRLPGLLEPEFKLGEANLSASTRMLATAPLILEEEK